MFRKIMGVLNLVLSFLGYAVSVYHLKLFDYASIISVVILLQPLHQRPLVVGLSLGSSVKYHYLLRSSSEGTTEEVSGEPHLEENHGSQFPVPCSKEQHDRVREGNHFGCNMAKDETIR